MIRIPFLLTHTIRNSSERFPEKIAFKCGNASISYQELVDLAHQLGNLLMKHGVQKGDRVGIYLNKSIESAIAVYGIMSAGAAFVPLDTTAPPNRTRFLLNDCEIEFLITHKSQRRTLKTVLEEKTPIKALIGIEGDWDCPTTSWEEIKSYSTQIPPVNILEQDLAYIMYTSGSTGLPKGIMHTHHSGLSYAQLSAELYDVGPEDRVGNHAPLHFDISTFGYFTSPLAGATTVLVPDAYAKLPASLSQLMEKEQLTIWYSVPLALTQLLSHGILEERDMSSLRWVLYGGEPFPIKHLRTLMEKWPKARFCNVYGPAEVNQCTYYHLEKSPNEGGSVPLGKIWDNAEMRIVDGNDKQVQPGEQGELLVRTPTMMQGYWNQPELTQKGLYFEEPYPGYRKTFYRTGDLVRIDESGNLLFLGRKDRQIKVRGNRIELDEIEAVLVSHPAVVEAAILAFRNENEERFIKGAVIKKEGVDILPEDLKQYISARMPIYAVPDDILILKEFPLYIEWKSRLSKIGKIKPIMEKTLLEYVQQKLLGKHTDIKLQPDDDLLGSGLVDSMGIMNLIAFIEERYEIPIPPEDMVIENFMNIEAITEYLKNRKAA